MDIDSLNSPSAHYNSRLSFLFVVRTDRKFSRNCALECTALKRKILSKRALAVHELLNGCYDDGFVLAGGTALALQFGHRLSVDFDFFKEGDFDVAALLRRLSKTLSLEVLLRDDHSLVALADKVKISFFRYWDRFLFPPLRAKDFVMADPRDIALMKIVAIANRGSRKDFIDLFFLLKKTLTLEELFTLLKKKFAKVDYNSHHILKSLVYPLRGRELKLRG